MLNDVVLIVQFTETIEATTAFTFQDQLPIHWDIEKVHLFYIQRLRNGWTRNQARNLGWESQSQTSARPFGAETFHKPLEYE